jgi:hypothetical protein
LYARGPKGASYTIYRDKGGRWWWRIWHHRGKLTVSATSFDDENAALDNLLDTLAVASALDL